MATATEIVTIKKVECHNCCGAGRIQAFSHIASGKCFRCGGTGRITVKITREDAIEEARRREEAAVAHAKEERQLDWLDKATPADLDRMTWAQLHAAWMLASTNVIPTAGHTITDRDRKIYAKVKRAREARA